MVSQFFPPMRSHSASDFSASFEAVVRTPAEVTAILGRTCRDCHLNHTAWPGYSAVAPVSCLIAQDVQEGRSHLNFSAWGGLRPESALANVREMCQEVQDQKMPPWYYLPLHPESKAGQTEIITLCAPSLTGFAEQPTELESGVHSPLQCITSVVVGHDRNSKRRLSCPKKVTEL